MRPGFVGIVDQQRCRLMLDEGSNAQMTRARREHIPVLILCGAIPFAMLCLLFDHMPLLKAHLAEISVTQKAKKNKWSDFIIASINGFSLCCLPQVVIMLVIDKANDRALLSRQSRYVPRMWSCLAGFTEVCTFLTPFL